MSGAVRRPLRVLMIAAEVAPFAYTGGLGDVLAGLSSALADAGCDVVVATPRYGVTRAPSAPQWWPEPVVARIGWGADDVRTLGVLEASIQTRVGSTFRVCFLDHPHLFARHGIYGDGHGAFGDNDVRFAAMSRGALAVAERVWREGPDVIHAHDWHAALAVVSSRLTMGAAWAAVPTAFTIHNLAFQGVFGPDALDRVGLPRASFDATSPAGLHKRSGALEHDGQVNLLKGAISLADRVTTVSPTYAREILGPHDGCGLDAVLREHRAKLVGIVNGIDEARFDPEGDTVIAARYDLTNALAGRAACKQALAAELGLAPDDGPLFASVGRLTEQKGVDLLLAIVPGLVERGTRFVLVGTGDARLEHALVAVAERFPGRVATRVAFDETLARRVYAGADFFVVPSRYEPCGLTQLYAMRYGAIPVVTNVGGLHDTVSPISAVFDTGTGFVAGEGATNSGSLLVACEDALALYRDPAMHRAAVRRAMARDSSWTGPAREYMAVYEALRR